MRLAEELARSHHEHWDGNGYPFGLRGDDIPLVSRIVSPVDVFDALTHERPYKRAWPVEQARTELVRLAGRQFDPAIVTAMLGCLDQNPEMFEFEPDAGNADQASNATRPPATVIATGTSRT